MKFKIETERQDDGRWIAEVPALPGVMVYGSTQGPSLRHQACAKVRALALRVIADRLDNGEPLRRENAK